MKLERTKNAKRNIVFGGVLKIYQIIIPFLMRTAMINLLGIEYLGLNSLFTSIINVLNLAELGVGSAMVFSMYKSIADEDEETICALMKLYRFYYRIIGLIVLIIGMLLLPFLPNIIKEGIPNDINISILYLMNLFATVLSYWMFAYRSSLLQAHQRNDIISKVIFFTDTVKYIFQIFILIVFKNYYYFLIIVIVTQILSNIITAYMSTKIYPNYVEKGKLPKEKIQDINRRIRDLFTSKLGGVIVTSVDTVVISSFLGLTVLAIYQNYYYIITAVIGVISVVYASCMAGIGNSLVVENTKKNYDDLVKITFMIAWIGGWGTICLLCLFQPFMKLWVGESYLLSMPSVVCFCIYFFIYEINQLLNLYKDAAGIWREDRFRPLITGILNLVLNLLTINILGIYGVILSTSLSMILLGMPWLVNNLFKHIFKRNPKMYVLKIFKYSIFTTVNGIITYFVCLTIKFDGITELILKFIICLVIPNLIFLFLYLRDKELYDCLELFDRITSNKLNLSRFKSEK